MPISLFLSTYYNQTLKPVFRFIGSNPFLHYMTEAQWKDHYKETPLVFDYIKQTVRYEKEK